MFCLDMIYKNPISFYETKGTMLMMYRTYPYKFFEGCLPNIFTWAILEYFVPNAGIEYFGKKNTQAIWEIQNIPR